MSSPLQTLPRRVFEGFGYSRRSESVFASPSSLAELRALFAQAQEEGLTVATRGGGRSYGDAALNRGGVILDLREMNRLLDFDAERGIVEAEPGVTIEDLWRTALPRGFWPRVVPGTMLPTLGGCASMNIHGKNHHQLGGFGDSILDCDLLTPGGELLTLSREENSQLFHAAISGFGMLGALTRIRLQLKPVASGRLRVQQLPARSLEHQIEIFEENEGKTDYTVGWLDCIHGGAGLGRGQIHLAHHLDETEDPDRQWLQAESQLLPPTILGVPRDLVGTLLSLFQGNRSMRFVNLGKYLASRFGSTRPYLQGHVAFHFLLDYVPTFRDAYRPGGLIQFQPFVPREHAVRVLREVLTRTQRAGLVSYLGVLKRHRPDDFLLSHALDGYSLALDLPVTAANRQALWKLCAELSELVLDAGGRFYPAKDSVMRPEDFRRSFGSSALETFRRLRERCDPDHLLHTELSERVGLDG